MAWGIVTSLTITENPGIYLRFDTGDLFVFDNVEAKVIKRDKENSTLSITNPTPYDGRISLFCEDSKMAGTVLDRYAFIKWPKVMVKSGETIVIQVTSDGLIKKL